MRYDAPETGGSAQGMYWGGYGFNVPNMTNYNQVVTWDEGTTTIGRNSYAYLAGEDGTFKNTPHGPNPYMSGDYLSNIYSIAGQGFADLDGAGNTDKIIAAATTDWSGSTITNSYEEGNYPAACCCRRYYTPGTQPGDWYLPAAGELAYMISKHLTIADTSTKLRNAGHSAPDLYSGWRWSSS